MVWFQRIQAAVKRKAACFTVSIVGYFFRLLYGLVSFRIELNELISARRRNDIDRFVEGECSRRFRLPRAIKFPQQPLPHAAETGHGREHRQRTRKRRFYS